jgi:catechol 2,3-dioxygenase-like lactoylglutathione lyase family enzyme
MDKVYDRTTQDVGNILGMEHLNVTVPNQELAQTFYVAGLGFTRDPYMMVGPENMWVNVGQQQFHLPTNTPQVFPGHIGLVVPDLEALKTRLVSVRERLAGTRFTCSQEEGYVAATCPWGNKFHCYEPAPQFGNITLGVPYVEFPVKPGAAAGIGQFYKEVFGAPYTLSQDMNAAKVCVKVGPQQCLIFRESTMDIPEYDGHHLAIYISNFSGPHAFLKQHALVTQETDDFQYRFQDIVHPETGRKLFTIEHEVRSMGHPMYGREFVNRNPSQSLRGYARGRDAFVAA